MDNTYLESFYLVRDGSKLKYFYEFRKGDKSFRCVSNGIAYKLYCNLCCRKASRFMPLSDNKSTRTQT